MLYTMVYKSDATTEMDRYELNALLHTARANNQSQGITGILLYADKHFIQVLEGEEQVVVQLYEKIEKDTRHINLFKLMANNIDKRMFPDWSMAYKKIDKEEYNNIPGLSLFLDDDRVSKPYDYLLKFKEDIN